MVERGDTTRRSPQNPPPVPPGTGKTADRHRAHRGKRQAARGPHQRYSVRVVGDRASGRWGLLAEGLHLLLGLNQHAPTLRVLLP